MAEAGGLNPLQHGFESHRGHCIDCLARFVRFADGLLLLRKLVADNMRHADVPGGSDQFREKSIAACPEIGAAPAQTSQLLQSLEERPPDLRSPKLIAVRQPRRLTRRTNTCCAVRTR